MYSKSILDRYEAFLQIYLLKNDDSARTDFQISGGLHL